VRVRVRTYAAPTQRVVRLGVRHGARSWAKRFLLTVTIELGPGFRNVANAIARGAQPPRPKAIVAVAGAARSLAVESDRPDGVERTLATGRKRSSATLTIDHGPGFRNVADAIVRVDIELTIGFSESARLRRRLAR
jgi:hypothetical protein